MCGERVTQEVVSTAQKKVVVTVIEEDMPPFVDRQNANITAPSIQRRERLICGVRSPSAYELILLVNE